MTKDNEGGVRVERMVRREATFHEGEHGIWELLCESCPLHVHQSALEQIPEACASGVVTNIQGPVVIKTCKHQAKDSLVNEGKKMFLMCAKQDA